MPSWCTGFRKALMSSSPLVSIVTPSYMQARFLRDSIDSVLSQTYPNIEYEVWDGDSTDESVEILRSYRDSIKWRSQPDDGQAAAINAGLREAKGEIVAFLNSDDVLLPGAVAAAVRLFAADPTVDVVYGRASIVDLAGRPLRQYSTHPFDANLLVQHCFVAQPAAFWRRSLHDRIGYFSTEFDHTLDYEFWIRAMKAGAKFLYTDEEWALAREHADAKSSRLRGEIFRQIIRLQLRHLGYCGRNWWEQYLRYLRDEQGGVWRALPGPRGSRLYRLAWLPYALWRTNLGGPLFHRPGDWRA